MAYRWGRLFLNRIAARGQLWSCCIPFKCKSGSGHRISEPSPQDMPASIDSCRSCFNSIWHLAFPLWTGGYSHPKAICIVPKMHFQTGNLRHYLSRGIWYTHLYSPISYFARIINIVPLIYKIPIILHALTRLAKVTAQGANPLSIDYEKNWAKGWGTDVLIAFQVIYPFF